MVERETSKSKSEETARESCHFWMARFALPAYGELLVLPPHHTVDDARVALDDLHDLGGDVLVRVVRHGHRGQRPLRVEGDRGAHGVEQAALMLTRSTDGVRDCGAHMRTELQRVRRSLNCAGCTSTCP